MSISRSYHIIEALGKLRSTSHLLAVTSDSLSNLLTSQSSQPQDACNISPQTRSFSTQQSHLGQPNPFSPSPRTTIHYQEMMNQAMRGKILTRKWDKDSRDPKDRPSPKMEEFKRGFIKWVLEGNDLEAVKLFQDIMREGLQKSPKVQKEYRPDRQLLDELYRTLIKIHDKALLKLDELAATSDILANGSGTLQPLADSPEIPRIQRKIPRPKKKIILTPENSATRTKLIQSHARDIEEALVWSKMHHHTPYENVYRSLLDAYMELGEIEKMNGVIERMRANDFVIYDQIMSQVALVHLRAAGQVEKAWSIIKPLIEAMEVNGSTTDGSQGNGGREDKKRLLLSTKSAIYNLTAFLKLFNYRYWSHGEGREWSEEVMRADAQVLAHVYPIYRRLSMKTEDGSDLYLIQGCIDAATRLNEFPLLNNILDDLGSECGLLPFPNNAIDYLTRTKTRDAAAPPSRLGYGIKYSLARAADESLSSAPTSVSIEICKKAFVLGASYNRSDLSTLFLYLLKAHARSGDFESVFQVLGSFEGESGNDHGRRRENLNPRKGLAFLTEAIGVDEATVAAAYDQLAARHSRSEPVTTLMLNIVLRSLAILPPPRDAVNPLEAEKVAAAAAVEATGRFFEEFGPAGVAHDVESYNAVMEACARASNLSAVSSLFSHMESGGDVRGEEEGQKGEGQGEGKPNPPRPNDGTYEILFKAHIDAGDYKGALTYIDQAIERAGRWGVGIRWVSTTVLKRGVELADKAGDEEAIVRFKRIIGRVSYLSSMREGSSSRYKSFPIGRC